jgi:hypothetical protein
MGKGSCGCSDSACSVDEGISDGICPVCSRQGLFVQNKTVQHVIKESGRQDLGDENYYLCLEANCPNGYYNN